MDEYPKIPDYSKQRGAHITKLVALGRSCRDAIVPLDASLGVHVLPAVEKEHLKIGPRGALSCVYTV